jgi:hypothetical protein
MIRGKIIFTGKVSREKPAANYPAAQKYLEFFLTVLFFIILIFTLAAFLFFAPLLIIL